MTFLKTRYKLKKELTPRDYQHLSRLSTVYGIRGLSFENQELVIEYDASRIHEAEVLASVRGTGVPVDPFNPSRRADSTIRANSTITPGPSRASPR